MIEILDLLQKVRFAKQVEYVTVYDKMGYCILEGVPVECYCNVSSLYNKEILMVVLNLKSRRIRIVKDIQRIGDNERIYRN